MHALMAISRDHRSIHTSQIKQTSVCHADTTQLLHVAYPDQSAHQTCSPKLILIFVFVLIRHLVPSQFKQCISSIFVKITMAMLMGANFHKFTGREAKYKIAIYNKTLK